MKVSPELRQHYKALLATAQTSPYYLVILAKWNASRAQSKTRPKRSRRGSRVSLPFHRPPPHSLPRLPGFVEVVIHLHCHRERGEAL